LKSWFLFYSEWWFGRLNVENYFYNPNLFFGEAGNSVGEKIFQNKFGKE
jgi:hypothetical protein